MNPEDYMKMALKEAEKAFRADEVPVGAVIVDPVGGAVVAKAHNLGEHGKDAAAHAELEAMRRACRKLKQNRLWGLDLYVTLEPCTMCAAAASLMRIRKNPFRRRRRQGRRGGKRRPLLPGADLSPPAGSRGAVCWRTRRRRC